MTERDSVALRAHLKGIIAASFVTLAVVASAAAFSIGFTGALNETLADPGSALRVRTAALQSLDQNLGYQGFLNIYRSFLSTGDRTQATELRVLVNEADANVARVLRVAATQTDRASPAALMRLEAPFRRAALFAAEPSDGARGAPSLAELEGDYATLRSRISADTAAANSARLNELAQALVWAQATSIGALTLLSTVLLALAWFLRERLIGPLENLRHSVAAASTGAVSQPLWGITRKDEIGALARAADGLRQAQLLQPSPMLPELHTQVMERLAQGAMRLEADLAKMATATSHARQRIEQAGLRAVKASHAAIEAAGVARDGAQRMAEQTEARMDSARHQSRAAIDALVAAVAQLSHATARLEGANSRDEASASISAPELEDADAAAVLDSLAGGLEALESFARERRSMADDQLVTLTSALLRAVDRLNAVAQAISGSADRTMMRSAG
jgi:HAMP domain-containing protein